MADLALLGALGYDAEILLNVWPAKLSLVLAVLVTDPFPRYYD